MSKADSKINVSFLLMTGLGDCIINKKFIQEFVKNIGDISNINIDIYVYKNAKTFIEAIFSDCNFIRKMYFTSEDHFKKTSCEYDISIKLHYFIEIWNLKLDNVDRVDWKLSMTMRRLQEFLKRYKLKISDPTDMYLHFSRCKYMGYNCYTSYNCGDIFHITDSKVKIPLKKQYKDNYDKLRLHKPYITLNYGWGSGKKNLPKAWPKKYYDELSKLIKFNFPGIKVVQVGTISSPKILNMDYYILGESLELVKYVLKGAELHIDCEGALVHVATQLGTKCVVLFGPTPVHYFGYERNDNLVSDKCNGCLFLNGDLTACTKRLTEPECMKWISPDVVMECVKKNLRRLFEGEVEINEPNGR